MLVGRALLLVMAITMKNRVRGDAAGESLSAAAVAVETVEEAMEPSDDTVTTPTSLSSQSDDNSTLSVPADWGAGAWFCAESRDATSSARRFIQLNCPEGEDQLLTSLHFVSCSSHLLHSMDKVQRSQNIPQARFLQYR